MPATPASTDAVNWQARLPIVAKGRYSPDDFKKARSLLGANTIWRGYALGVVLALGLLGYSYATGDSAERSSVWFTLTIVITGASVFLYFFVLAPRRKARKDWEAGLPPYDDRTLTFSQDGVSCVTNLTTADINWPAFVDMKQTPDLLLLFLQTNGECVIVPKSFVQSAEDWLGLLTLASAKVHPKSK